MARSKISSGSKQQHNGKNHGIAKTAPVSTVATTPVVATYKL